MLKFNNDHIFTGYLKQLLSTVNLPTCRIYTKEYAQYYQKYKKEDPRIVESFNTIITNPNKNETRISSRTLYLKHNELFSYFWDTSRGISTTNKTASWIPTTSFYYNKDKSIPGLTRTLNSLGIVYDTATHEYLGEYLRFLRDYYDVNLMSLYNCFNNKAYNNIDYTILDNTNKTNISTFDSKDTNFKIYAFPVKLFANYTIAIDCDQSVELFCGFYKTSLDKSAKGQDLIKRTYRKLSKTIFKQPFLYKGLDVENWNYQQEITPDNAGNILFLNNKKISRCDIMNKEQDLKLFIKIPATCKSSIVVLEGDYRNFNDFQYLPYKITCTKENGEIAEEDTWIYKQNHTILNFNTNDYPTEVELNNYDFKPISKLQLLAYNAEESYPFADRLIEYLCNSAITPMDEISDNIKRAQEVMKQNNYYFKIDGLWENKMQKIIYDYLLNRGPVTFDSKTKKLKVGNQGRYPIIGYAKKSTLYDILGYVDKDAEKWYASWSTNKKIDEVSEKELSKVKPKVKDSIQNIDIYDGLYDI